jgi:riboflavin synthase
MFTGIITGLGTVLHIEERGNGRSYIIASPYDIDTIPVGASIAHSGVCLTVTDKGHNNNQDWYSVDASSETLALTTLNDWRSGDKINLERSLKAEDELGGHSVSGHVEGTATIVGREPQTDGSIRFIIQVPEHFAAFIRPKGSITLDGTSLTINKVDGHTIELMLIPHTLAVTTWGLKKMGERVNVEPDHSHSAKDVSEGQSHQNGVPFYDPDRPNPHLLILTANFYQDLAHELEQGAVQVLHDKGLTFETVSVPGVLELPSALAMALQCVDDKQHFVYDGYILLGCVIRGETSHYDIVANESARAILQLATQHRLALGNGILTVENGEQAKVRASVHQKNKGAAAAHAALSLIHLRKHLRTRSHLQD